MDCLRLPEYHARRGRERVDPSCAITAVSPPVAICTRAKGEQTYHFLLDEGFECIHLAIVLSLYQSDFTESTLANDLQCVVVLRLFTSTQESQEVGFRFTHRVLLPLFTIVRKILVVQDKFEVLGSGVSLEMNRNARSCVENGPLITSSCSLDILLEELLREQLLNLDSFSNSSRVLVGILRRRFIVVDARLLRHSWHWRAEIAVLVATGIACGSWS